MEVTTKVTVELTLEEAAELREFFDYPERFKKQLPEAAETLMVQLPRL